MSSGGMRVEVANGDDTTHLEFPEHGRLWIGRDASCEVVLRSELVSRRHASVALLDGTMTVTDSSANGTYVGKVVLRRSSCELAPGARIAVGPYTLGFTLLSQKREGAPGRAGPREAALRRRIHGLLMESLDHRKIEPGSVTESLRADVHRALERLVGQEAAGLEEAHRRSLVEELAHEVLGLGPLEPLLADESISEIMVVDAETVFIERHGKLERTGCRFTDVESVRAIIERIVTPLGRRIDESCPIVDARLADGSRVNAVIPPLAVRGPCITIRKFQNHALTLADLIGRSAMTPRMGLFLERCVRARKNVVVSGGTGSGKTTLLNALSVVIPESERLVTVEDAAELQLGQPHVVTLEARGPNMEGKGAYTIRDLVKNALRMRPDRILVGECRGGEALDMLQAMNTGHDGSMTTVHANSPREAIARLETLCLMSGVDLPITAIRRQIATSVHVIAQAVRFSDGTRRVTSVSEVTGLRESGEVGVEEIFCFERLSTKRNGEIVGEFRPTGHVPSFIDAFIASGLTRNGDFL